MKRYDFWKLSLLNIFSAPLKSVLTVLGFAIGVAAVLAVITLGDAGKNEVESEMTRLGIDRIWVSPLKQNDLPMGSSERLETDTGIFAYEMLYVPVVIEGENGKTIETTAIGCEFGYLRELILSKGRKPLYSEWVGKLPEVLIGENAAKQIGGRCGDIVMIAQKGYRVCGILSSGNGVSTIPVEKAVVLPLQELAFYTEGNIHELQIYVHEKMSVKQTEQLALRSLTREGNEVETVTMAVQMEAASSVVGTFVNVLKWVALVCVLCGGIGIMNILFVSIRERKREIGVMKAMGATTMQICILFLSEALIYAVIGGILGIWLGVGLIFAAGKSIMLAAQASVTDCFLLLTGASAAGIVFGVLPAILACRLKCVDALRQD